jgi:hypothetical protein
MPTWPSSGKWGAPVGNGGGGSALGYWDPMATPATPNVADLEFSSSAPGLTLVDPGSTGAALSYRSGAARVSLPHSVGVVFKGARCNAPATSAWSVTAKIGATAVGGISGLAYGLAVAASGFDGAPTTTRFRMIDHLIGGAGRGARVVDWTNYAGSPTVDANFENIYVTQNASWFRIRYNSSGTVLSFDRSDDGLSWHQLFTTSSPGFVPARILVLGSPFGGTAAAGELAVQFLRFTDSADLLQASTGRVV